MNQKQIGTILIILGILSGAFVYFAKARENATLNKIIQQQGSCFLDDGTCLHANKGLGFYLLGGIISAALTLLGLYLLIFDKTQQILATQHLEVSSALKEAKKQEREKDEFHAYLSGFNEHEQKVLHAVHEQDGILQSTLRYRTGMSKTALSLILKSLEQKDIISRKVSGKTNAIYLRKKF
jgi:uncharacterized membrane protein